MKKILALSLSLSIMVSLATAQISHTRSGQVDKNATEILSKANKKLTTNAVSFTVTMVNKNSDKKETARQDADVLYNKGKYRVSFDGNVIYCDGVSTWHWNKEAKEVVVNNMSQSPDDLMNPAALLSNYGKDFNAKFIRKEQNGDAVIDLTPKKSKSYYKIRIIVNADNGNIRRMEMHNYDGSCGEYHISGFKSGVKSSEADFTFSKTQNPGVEIIDMR